MEEEIDLEMFSFQQFSEIQKLCDLDLGSGQGHINIHNYRHAQPRECRIMHYWNMAIWVSWNTDIPLSSNSHDSFPKRKIENRLRKAVD